MKITIEVISAKDEDYKKVMELITEVLHEPFGIPPYVIMPGNENNTALLAYNGKNLAGCLVIFIEENVMEVRQLAVKASMQKLGIGGALIDYAENLAKQSNVKRIELCSRATSQKFYEKHNFECVSEPYNNNIRGIDIKSVKMKKELL